MRCANEMAGYWQITICLSFLRVLSTNSLFSRGMATCFSSSPS